MDAGLSARLADLDARIAEAARAAGRDPDELTRIVVTKFHPVSLVYALDGLGVREVGESRAQELIEKAEQARSLSELRWHFIGQLQTNKARSVRAAAAAVHSLDRARLADALHAAAQPDDPTLDVLIQVNLTDDPGRGGVAAHDLAALAEHVAELGSLRIRGLMAVAPLHEEPARAFARVRALGDRLREIVPDATWMSAGMSGDFAEAIAAGATHLRIGTAITGPRPSRG